MDKEEHIKYWLESSNHDLESSIEYFEKSTNNDWTLFIAHLSLEKILKAAWLKIIIKILHH